MTDTRRARGNNFQDWICKYLSKNEGMVCHNQKAMAKWLPYCQKWVSTRNDILGCIDVIGVNRDRMVFIQATLHTGVGKKEKDLQSVPWPDIKGVDVELWQKKGPRRIVVFKMIGGKLEKIAEIINGRLFS
jgi:hypothetical protein